MENNTQLIIYLLLFVMGGIITSLTELEKLRRVRIIYLLVGSLLFFISGILTGLYLR